MQILAILSDYRIINFIFFELYIFSIFDMFYNENNNSFKTV